MGSANRSRAPQQRGLEKQNQRNVIRRAGEKSPTLRIALLCHRHSSIYTPIFSVIFILLFISNHFVYLIGTCLEAKRHSTEKLSEPRSIKEQFVFSEKYQLYQMKSYYRAKQTTVNIEVTCFIRYVHIVGYSCYVFYAKAKRIGPASTFIPQ